MKTLTALFTLLGICYFSAQENVDEVETYPLENTFLWKIEGLDLQKPSYLYGTMHLLCKENFNLKPTVLEAMKETEQLVLELDMDDPNFLVDTQKSLMTDKLLTENLNEEDLEIVSKFIQEKTGGTLEMYDSVSPFLIYSLSFSNLLNCETTGVDVELMKLNGAKEVKGLERIEYQMDIMNEVINYDNIAELIQDFNPEDLTTQEKLYSENDLVGMQEYIIDSYKKDPKLYNNILKVRNQNWIKEMPEIMEKTPSFFAVGAGHLMGNIGLIKLLRDKGYKVSPVF